MPNNLLFADMSMFPVIGEEEETRSALKKILNYQFLLTEQLRYTLYNLGEENLNEAEWHSLTEPIYARIQDADGNIAELSLNAKELRAKLSDAEGNIGQLSLTAESLSTQISNAQGDISSLHQTAESLSTQISNAQGDISTLKQTAQSLSTQISNAQGDINSLQLTAESLSSKITNAQGDISSLHQTAESLSSRITNAQGDISTLSQTADSLSSRISNAQGDINTLSQTADSLSSRISNAQGDISTLSQTANSLSSRISNAQDSVSTLRQDVESITLSVENGDKSSTISLKMDETVISSGRIKLAGDVVFVDDLTDGTTEISGDNIQTGALYAEYLQLNGFFEIYSGREFYGYMGAANGNDGSDIATEGVVLQGTDEDYYLIVTNKGVRMQTEGTSFYCSDHQIYSSIPIQDGSDRRIKKDIDYDLNRYADFFMSLSPCVFRRIDGSSNRFHGGFIAQEVETALLNNGLTTFDFAGLVINPEAVGYGPENPFYCLRYSEFIALNTYMIQKLYRRVEALESRI